MIQTLNSIPFDDWITSNYNGNEDN